MAEKMIEVTLVASKEVIDAQDLVAAVKKTVNQMGPKEPSTSGDKNTLPREMT
jgi:hypothetical protein